MVQLPHRLRQLGLWGIEADIFIADLAPLDLDPRTERSLREAIESYRSGVFLAASSLLGVAVEGAWYAAGQRLRSKLPAVDQLADGDRTAQLQGAVTDALRNSLPGSRKWEADSLCQFARLMRDIRNYGVHGPGRPWRPAPTTRPTNMIRFASPRSVKRNHLPVRDYRYPHLEP